MISGLLRWVPLPVAVALVIIVVALAVARDTFGVDVPFPQSFRQVPPEIFRLDPRRAVYKFGVDMGTGVRTKMTASSTYVVALGLALVGPSLPVALLAGVGFGVGRGVTVYVRHAFVDRIAWDARFITRGRAIKSALLVSATVAVLVELIV